jgi:hypothetical protein
MLLISGMVVLNCATCKRRTLNRKSDGLRDGRPGFESRQKQEISLLSIAFRADLGLTQPPSQWVWGLFARIKASGA